MVRLDRCNGSFNTFDDTSCRICVLKKKKRCKVKFIQYDNTSETINKYK